MKSQHLSIIAKKEFRGLFNERTILLAVLLLLFSAFRNRDAARGKVGSRG